MITKAYIINKEANSNKYIVRIPIFEKPGVNSATSNLSTTLFSATLAHEPSVVDVYNSGDCVFVGFENNELNRPVILGKLYTKEESSKATGFINSKVLNVSDKATLPADTTIGSVNFSNLSNFFNSINDFLTKISTSSSSHNLLSGRDLENSHPATAISYENLISGLTATNVKTAIDELSTEKVNILNGSATELTVTNDGTGVGDVPLKVNAITGTIANLQEWNVNSISKVVISKDGNVGIGFDTPTSKLEVNGTTKLQGLTTITGGLTFSGGNITSGTFGAGNVGAITLYASDDVNISSKGSVGGSQILSIGAEQTGSTFSGIVNITAKSVSLDKNMVYIKADGTSRFSEIVLTDKSFAVRKVGQSSVFDIDVNDIDGTGITTTKTIIRQKEKTGTNQVGLSLAISSGQGTGIGAVSSIKFRTPKVGVSGAVVQTLEDRLTIDSTGLTATGDVRIGPAYEPGALSVQATTANIVNFRDSDGENVFSVSGVLLQNDLAIKIGDHNAIQNNTYIGLEDGNSKIYLMASNVGIGVETPTAKLDVDGDIKSSGEITTGSGTTNTWTIEGETDFKISQATTPIITIYATETSGDYPVKVNINAKTTISELEFGGW